MVKRVRGSTSRPGQRAPIQRSAPRPRTTASSEPAAPLRSTSLTPEEEARAAALEAQLVADERAAEAAARRVRDRARADVGPVSTRPGSLAVQAAEEYAYVVRDVRRIAIIGGGLIGLLLAGWAVVQATGAGV